MTSLFHKSKARVNDYVVTFLLLPDIHTDTINKVLRKVRDYWDHSRNNEKWRIWKLPDYRERGRMQTQAIALNGILGTRQILTSTLENQLRWGKNNTCIFTLKEAKRIDTKLNYPNIDKKWKEVWDNPHWMKFKLFKWLVLQGKILTWDNLRKRGFVVPSRCHLCGQQEETTNHLLNKCSFTIILWHWVVDVFKQTDTNVNDIISTLINWMKFFSENEIITSAWALTPRFLIWNVWKERNNRIFKDKASPVSSILKLILKQLKEAVNILGGADTEKLIRQREAKILEKLEFKLHLPQCSMQINMNTSTRKASWHPLLMVFLKFNIDVASKGNLGEAGYGGVLRDDEGNILVSLHSYLGKATNNMAELMVMELCLEILLKHNIHNVIIEANSKLVINSVKRVNVGTAPEKILGHSWLLQVYQRIQSHLNVLRTLRLVHVCKKANKVAD